jgi:hypothetical protein
MSICRHTVIREQDTNDVRVFIDTENGEPVQADIPLDDLRMTIKYSDVDEIAAIKARARQANRAGTFVSLADLMRLSYLRTIQRPLASPSKPMRTCQFVGDLDQAAKELGIPNA